MHSLSPTLYHHQSYCSDSSPSSTPGGGAGELARTEGRQVLGGCGLYSVLEIKRMGREIIQNCMTRRQKLSNIFHGIRMRHPRCEEAKCEREDRGVVIQIEKVSLSTCHSALWGLQRRCVYVCTWEGSHVYTHTHTISGPLEFPVRKTDTFTNT